MPEAKSGKGRARGTTGRGRERVRSTAVSADAAAPAPPLCSVAFCPICTAVTAFGEARPDLVEHLVMAGREMLLAIRAIIDARLEGAGEPPAKLERLTVE